MSASPVPPASETASTTQTPHDDVPVPLETTAAAPTLDLNDDDHVVLVIQLGKSGIASNDIKSAIQGLWDVQGELSKSSSNVVDRIRSVEEARGKWNIFNDIVTQAEAVRGRTAELPSWVERFAKALVSAEKNAKEAVIARYGVAKKTMSSRGSVSRVGSPIVEDLPETTEEKTEEDESEDEGEDEAEGEVTMEEEPEAAPAPAVVKSERGAAAVAAPLYVQYDMPCAQCKAKGIPCEGEAGTTCRYCKRQKRRCEKSKGKAPRKVVGKRDAEDEDDEDTRTERRPKPIKRGEPKGKGVPPRRTPAIMVEIPASRPATRAGGTKRKVWAMDPIEDSEDEEMMEAGPSRRMKKSRQEREEEIWGEFRDTAEMRFIAASRRVQSLEAQLERVMAQLAEAKVDAKKCLRAVDRK